MRRPITAPRGPGPRGWTGRGQGGARLVEAAPELRATTVQTCGLWPFALGSGAPLIGVPLGRHLLGGESVACDPISWFHPGALIPNPSAMIIASPGLGKSTVARRMQLGLAAMGVNPFVVGDLKGEHAPLVRALGGAVVTLGRGEGSLNVLDPGSAMAAARRLQGRARDKLVADLLGRRLNALAGLIALNRRGAVSDVEEAVL
ncbi:MAG TPA: ATP/GTP-binding protein, partial [Actinomycetota bacterium]|nr:ATP/GTP-binding protein [Actinomycetota bacterium]